MRANGFKPQTCDFFDNCDHKGFYEDIVFPSESFDAVWCAHVLEHVLNLHNFLIKINREIREGGLLAITVPVFHENIVGGHINFFHEGLLLYRLILAGFDCSDAMVSRYLSEQLSVITRVKKIKNMPKLKYDNGDIETLSEFFPLITYRDSTVPVKAFQRFCGSNISVNWD